MPNFASSTDRWRSVGTGADGDEYYLDVKSAEFPNGGVVSLWIKTKEKKVTKTLAFEINCQSRQLNQTSATTYDAAGKVLMSSDVATGWQTIIPDTVGEQLYLGACAPHR